MYQTKCASRTALLLVWLGGWNCPQQDAVCWRLLPMMSGSKESTALPYPVDNPGYNYGAKFIDLSGQPDVIYPSTRGRCRVGLPRSKIRNRKMINPRFSGALWQPRWCRPLKNSAVRCVVGRQLDTIAFTVSSFDQHTRSAACARRDAQELHQSGAAGCAARCIWQPKPSIWKAPF